MLPVVGAPASATQLTLGAGSVWFETRLLVTAIGAGRFSGFRISGGTLTSTAPVTLQGAGHVVPAGATLTLTATLVPPPPGAGTPGGDLTGADLALPGTVTIRFTQTAAAIEALSDSRATLYGSTVDLTWNHATPQPLTGLPAILVPCTPSAPDFTFATIASTTFQPSGTAPINAAGWSLPVATTTIAALGEASGAGALVLELGEGASLACAGRGGAGAIGGWFISADPASLVVIAGGTGTAGFTAYTLWPATPPATVPSTVDWINLAGFVASLHASPGHETLALTGVTAAFLDRPLAVDGGALPIGGGGLLILDTDATATTLSILGQAAPPPTETFSLALENALMGVRGPRLLLVSGPLADPAATVIAAGSVTLLLDSLWLVPILPDPYAASFDAGSVRDRPALGLLGMTFAWSGADVAATVAINAVPTAAPSPAFNAVAPPPILRLAC